MRAEVEEEKVLVSALTKPLHLTQLEEQAIQAELLDHTRVVPNIWSIILPDIRPDTAGWITDWIS